MSSPDENQSSISIASTVAQILESGGTAVLATIIDGPANIGAKLLITASGTTTGSLRDGLLDQAVIQQSSVFLKSKHSTQSLSVPEFAAALTGSSEVKVLFERIQPEARLVICGAGHVGAALARVATVLGYGAILIDDRAEFVSRQLFPDPRIELVAAESWPEAVATAIGNGHGVSVAVVTRGHSEDESCMNAILKTNPDYVGMIGSKRRTRIVLERLRASGVAPEKLEMVHAPIGLDIGAVTPEEVALAIMAEIVAVRRGGTGGPLS
jgi:xanthine dehydrogenase accessory factor